MRLNVCTHRLDSFLHISGCTCSTKHLLVQVSRPRYNWHWYQNSSSRGCIRRKIKAAFHNLHVIFPIIKESPPCFLLYRCLSASTNQRVFYLATWAYWARPSSWGTPLNSRRCVVASSYRHDEEYVARPSLSQTVAVIRPHSRVSQYGYVVRNKTHMCSCCS